ncbi:MAG: response regulator [Rhodobacteraceae bacterium]|nr:response regulator [Paracoccaceae bacterium]
MIDTKQFKEFHVLIVDDDLAFLDVMEAMLNQIGITHIARADSGSQALGAISDLKRPVDCTICDVKMSNGNGLQLLKFVRMGRINHIRPDSCFILLTSSSDTETVKVAAKLDVNAYLIKPVTPEKLSTAIAKARSKYFPVNFDKYANIAVPNASS